MYRFTSYILYDMYNTIILYIYILIYIHIHVRTYFKTDDTQTSAEQRRRAATERVRRTIIIINNIHRFFSLFYKCARGGFPSLTRSKLNISFSLSLSFSLNITLPLSLAVFFHPTYHIIKYNIIYRQ